MADRYRSNRSRRRKKRSPKRLGLILLFEVLLLVILAGSFYFITRSNRKSDDPNKHLGGKQDEKNVDNDNKDNKGEKLTPEQEEALKEQERIKQEMAEREAIIEEANKLTLSYDYDGAIDLIKTYQGKEGGYEVYPALLKAIEDLEAEKDSLLLYGGSYRSVTEFNHIFFHSLIADNSKAFDGDYDSVGYNMYMTTVYEFKKMMQAMYEDGYVLVSVHDLAKQITDEDGNTKFVPGEIYLPEGKKPFVLSQDDVNYYDYMEGDGFASRIVIGEDGKPTCEMILEDGSVVQGPFDIVPILDEFVEEHPDFSYRGAKGILALTGYEGALGYRTNDPTSPTYEQDKETVKEVARVLKENGWEFASHSWSHRNMGEKSFEFIKQDTDRWLEEVGSLIGPTDILIFPYGVDIERTMGHYSSNKYHYLKEVGFNYFHGVDSKPWMHLKDDYVRMTRRPLDGQAMLQFPERLQDLFILEEIIDPERPPMNW
ncbi:MAG: polysaccharide deacetylase family protein [Bacillota bacterium]|nr:polysaccharide deacetylase family protein [Bacillota bacterium]